MLSVGTKIRIKSYEEIKETLDADNKLESVYFVSEMKNSINKEAIILHTNSNNTYSIDMDCYHWRPEWFDVISEDIVESDIWSGTESDIMLNLAMFHQVESGNKLSLNILRSSILNDCGFPSQSFGGFNYDSYPDEYWLYSHPICTNPPNYKWLKLKPKIVEKIIKYVNKEHLSLKPLVNYQNSPSYWFSWDATPEGYAYWEEFALNYCQTTTISTTELTNLIIKENERNQIKLQRKKTSIRVGTVPEGCRVHGKGCKASVRCRHLSHSARVGY